MSVSHRNKSALGTLEKGISVGFNDVRIMRTVSPANLKNTQTVQDNAINVIEIILIYRYIGTIVAYQSLVLLTIFDYNLFELSFFLHFMQISCGLKRVL